MEKLIKPNCLGKFFNPIQGMNCDICESRNGCYAKFREKEKRLEELKNRQSIPWYKNCNIELGKCDKCG